MEKLKIDLKAGLEIHQQLDTHKLFCNCPSILRQDNPNVTFMRRLHAVAGESGEIDSAARFEVGKDREFLYEGYSNSTCLVEYDESPPYEINQEALKIALQISILLNAEILPYTQIMRKTVVDGSNTSGFQRSLLIARKGYIETQAGKIGIDSIALEEDAARIISQEHGKVIYRLDRLGIPLVEITTSPDIKTSEQAKESALHLGEILRACKVKRGIGTIRQDVNISIPGSQRIEIKGVQEPELIIKTINSEIKRQQELVKKKQSKAEVRKANSDGSTTFLRPMPGSARMYPETDLPLLHISRELVNEVKKSLPKLKSEIKQELGKTGLSEEMTKLLLQENMLKEFEALIKLYNHPNFIVKALILWPKEIASKEKLSDKEKRERLSTDIIESIIEKVVKGKIKQDEVKQIMTELAKGKSLEEATKKEKRAEVNLEEEILKIIKEKPNLGANAYMGLIMQKFKGKISGKEVMDILKKLGKS